MISRCSRCPLLSSSGETDTTILWPPRGGAARRDVLAATDVPGYSEDDDLSYEAWAARKKAAEKGGDTPEKPGSDPK